MKSSNLLRWEIRIEIFIFNLLFLLFIATEMKNQPSAKISEWTQEVLRLFIFKTLMILSFAITKVFLHPVFGRNLFLSLSTRYELLYVAIDDASCEVCVTRGHRVNKIGARYRDPLTVRNRMTIAKFWDSPLNIDFLYRLGDVQC